MARRAAKHALLFYEKSLPCMKARASCSLLRPCSRVSLFQLVLNSTAGCSRQRKWGYFVGSPSSIAPSWLLSCAYAPTDRSVHSVARVATICTRMRPAKPLLEVAGLVDEVEINDQHSLRPRPTGPLPPFDDLNSQACCTVVLRFPQNGHLPLCAMALTAPDPLRPKTQRRPPGDLRRHRSAPARSWCGAQAGRAGSASPLRGCWRRWPVLDRAAPTPGVC